MAGVFNLLAHGLTGWVLGDLPSRSSCLPRSMVFSGMIVSSRSDRATSDLPAGRAPQVTTAGSRAGKTGHPLIAR